MYYELKIKDKVVMCDTVYNITVPNHSIPSYGNDNGLTNAPSFYYCAHGNETNAPNIYYYMHGNEIKSMNDLPSLEDALIDPVKPGNPMSALLHLNDDPNKWLETIKGLNVVLSGDNNRVQLYRQSRSKWSWSRLDPPLTKVMNTVTLRDEVNAYFDDLIRGDTFDPAFTYMGPSYSPHEHPKSVSTFLMQGFMGMGSSYSPHEHPKSVFTFLMQGFMGGVGIFSLNYYLHTIAMDASGSEIELAFASTGRDKWSSLTPVELLKVSALTLSPDINPVVVDRYLAHYERRERETSGSFDFSPHHLIAMSDIFKRSTNDNKSMMDHIAERVDVEYWDGSLKIKSLIKGGVGHREALKILYGDRRCFDTMSMRDIVSVVDALNHVGYMNAAWLSGYIKIAHRYDDNEFMRWSNYVRTWEQYQWLLKHHTKLKGSTYVDVELDDGTVVKWQWHLHRILSLDPECWVRGRYTGYKRLHRLAASQAREEGYEAMNELTEFPEFPGDIPDHVTYLSNSRALIKEGKEMHHCVGGYVSSCSTGNSFIFHVDDTVDPSAPGYTVELASQDDEWVIIQLRGYDNEPVPESEVTSIYEWVDQLNTPLH